MPRTSSLDDSFVMLPVYIASAMGVNRDWIEHARCRPKDGMPRDPRNPWTIASSESISVDGAIYEGTKLIHWALLICANCPAQWDCVRFAVDTDTNWGTWGCDVSDLRWLRKNDRRKRTGRVDVDRLLDQAKAEGTPVQVAIRRVRVGLGGVPGRGRRRTSVAV